MGQSNKNKQGKNKKQLDELWQYAQNIAAAELPDTNPSGFDKIDAEKVEKTIEQINEVLKDKPVSKSVKQKLNYAKKNWSANLKKYEQQEKVLGERNSYSKTDTDATFMRMKCEAFVNTY